ncbi:hypothetical protein M408DRAFT_325579 [Serendipita vermifera MAFF 305830]|uniref:Major facilitator superfamily (MFS) profile domain-containing protein n=1 Tax=Serendipita vermifera MAFF 305830 TaxID=933852 RepID=A0A0C3BRG2_SERVB|nr:hypothetical protein M408DRAFT_325579 [Serendipita vermifera MAFF 305830]
MADLDTKDRKDSSSDHIDQGPTHNDTVAPERHGFAKLYYHPLAQVIMLGFVLFMGPGMFNALNGLGAGGQVDSETSANANAAVYATFAFTAFFAGSINNKLGSRLTLFLGSLGYSLYIASYLVMEYHSNAGGFVIAAGVILGICAGLLWTAHGSLIMAYPTEQKKGWYISICWAIFNMGAVIGAATSLGQNINSTSNHVGAGTYIGFLVLTLIGSTLPLFMADPKKMYRVDGTRILIARNPTWKAEFFSIFLALWTDPWIALLLPMFWASNWFYTWQFNNYNAALFDIGGRSVNSFVYWLSQIVGSILIGLLLDTKGLKRRTRAFLGWGILLALVFIVHIWAYFYQRDYSRESVAAEGFQLINIHDSSYPAHIWLYIFCGLMDSMWQTAAYWMIGSMSNDPAKLAHFAGLYKSIQSAGGAVAWRLDALKTPYMNLFISTWVLLTVGLLFALPMLIVRVKEHTGLAEEIMVRMDEHGRVRDVAEVEEKQADAPTKGDQV